VFELPKSLPKRIALIAAAVFFFVAGVSHFTNAEFFLAIVPPYLPAPLALVTISGIFEILGGLGVMLPATRRAAGWGLIALLLAVYPANIHMALHPEQFEEMSRGALLARLPLQFVFIAWVWWATRPDAAGDSAAANAA
jgi:uncharacterized membrane protein